jgi:RNA polymerase sigma-70 factor (ECF subfamily)
MSRRRKKRWSRVLLVEWKKRETEKRDDVRQETRLEQDAIDDIRRAVRSLSPRQRQVLDLVFYPGMSISEAASVLQLSIGTARTHYDRGKKELSLRLRDTNEQ